MSTNARSQVTLQLKADGRDVNKLDKKLKETFKSGRMRGFNKAMDEVSRGMQALIRLTEKLHTSLSRTDKSSKAYRDLAADLRKARVEAARLQKELDGGARRGGGRGRGGGGGGSWGGMGRAHVPMPTAGALASGLSAIPLAGPLAAGGVLASYSMYSSALRHAQTRRDTYAYLGGTVAQKAGLAGGLRRARGTSLSADDLGSVQDRDLYRRWEGEHSALTGGAGSLTAAQANLGIKTSGVTASEAREIDRSEGRKFQRQRGYDQAAATDKARTLETKRAEARRAAIAAAGATRPVDLEAVGAAYGVAPSQALQEASQLSQGIGYRAGAGTYDFARAAQTAFGVGVGQTGQMLRSTGRTMGRGAGSGGEDVVARLIGSAVAAGLEGSEIAEYLSGIQGILRRQMELGQDVSSLEGMMNMERRLQTVVGGYMAGKVTQGYGQAVTGMMASGGGDTADQFMLLRAAGYTGEGGPEEYAKYMLDLQEFGAATATMPGYLQNFTGASGLGPNMRALLVQRALSDKGGVGATTARALAGGIPLAGAASGGMTAGGIIDAGRAGVSTVAGLTQVEAGLEGKRIEAGYRAAQQVTALNEALINLADGIQTGLGPILDDLTSKVRDVSAYRPDGSGVGGG